MKKISIILCLVAFLGFAFSPVVMSNNNETVSVLTDTTKTVKKTKTKSKSDCATKCCSHSCDKSKKTEQTDKTKTDPKKTN